MIHNSKRALLSQNRVFLRTDVAWSWWSEQCDQVIDFVVSFVRALETMLSDV